MKRTGTSMMMECLEMGGLEISWSRSRDKDLHDELPNNPNAHFYELDFVECIWLPLTKYRGTCIKQMGATCLNRGISPMRVVYMIRDEAAQSQSQFHACNMPLKTERYQQKNFACIAAMQNSDEVESCYVANYDEVLKDPLQTFRRLKDDGWPIDPEKAAKGVKPELKHY